MRLTRRAMIGGVAAAWVAHGGAIAQPAAGCCGAETLTRADLLPVLRSEAFAANVRRRFGGGAGPVLVARPFLPGVVELVVHDTPQMQRYVGRREPLLQEIGPEEAFKLAKRNLIARLGGIPVASYGDKMFIVNTKEPDYNSSALLLHDLWTELSRQAGGPLVVAAPQRATVMAGVAAPPAIEALRKFIAEERGGPHPVCERLLRFEDGRWSTQA